tara:strand:+ start:878 stop:1483 length:606 start_codon:yes stop_codon:yes gene_type:complete
MNHEYLFSQYKKGRDLIFDLDNTIYPENSFLFIAYGKISNRYPLNLRNDIKTYLENEFIKGKRKNLFNNLLTIFPNSTLSVNDCINILRSKQKENSLKTYIWFQNLLDLINDIFDLYIITNGNPIQQKNKIKAINFPYLVNLKQVIYANEIEAKPSPKSFYKLKNYQDLIDPIYIGDSKSDEQFCDNLKIEFFNINVITNN